MSKLKPKFPKSLKKFAVASQNAYIYATNDPNKLLNIKQSFIKYCNQQFDIILSLSDKDISVFIKKNEIIISHEGTHIGNETQNRDLT